MAAIDASVSDPQSAAPWQLTDLISVESLQSLQDTFARAFGLPTVIVDTTGAQVTNITQRSRFCEDLTRTSTAGSRCTECDLGAMREAARTGKPSIFKCWNGLYDSAIPIRVKGHVLGFFLCGQILSERTDPTRYARTAAEIGVDPEQYLEALEDVRVLPLRRYEASIESMYVLARMIAEQAAVAVDTLEMLMQARKAREDTAHLDAELDTILEALRDIGSQPDYEATLSSIADNLARLIPWDTCVIYLTNDDTDELTPVVVRDPYADQVRRHRPRKGHGIIGTAAMGGAGRRFSDITREPDFEPTPGVPVEPESALVMPMIYKGTLSGVIFVSRFDRRTFSDRELRMLDVFSSQASVSVQVSKLASENARRLREEHMFERMRLAMSRRTTVQAMLAEVARAGMDLLAADAAIVRATDPVLPASTVRNAIDEAAATELCAVLEPAIRCAAALGKPQMADHEGGSALVLPLAREEADSFAVFWREERGAWDPQLVESLGEQALLGIEKVRMHERERRLLAQYQHLSELGSELITARDPEEVRERLLARAPEVFSSDACFIALLDEGPDAIAIELLHGSQRERRTVALAGGARLASVRLRGEPTPDRSVFDMWSQEVFAAVGPDSGLMSWLAEPLPLSVGALGGVFVGWTSPEPPIFPEQRRILRVVASATGTALARFAASMATDSILRDRVRELEALTHLTERISALTDEQSIAKELLVALRRVDGLHGAIYGRCTERGPEILQTSGLADEARADVMRALGDLTEISDGTRMALANGSLEAILFPLQQCGDGSFVGGIAPRAEGDQHDRVMATLARYGAVALENARCHDRGREAILRLEREHVETSRQKTKLEQILSVHEMLGVAVLEGRGLPSVVRSLGTFIEAKMLVLAAGGRVVAAWPADDQLDWRPDMTSDERPRTIVEEVEGGHVIAAPAVVDGAALGWIIACMRTPPDDVARAAVQHGALLVALELLRERTAIEVETQLRGGMIEELFGEAVVEDLVVKRALAFGYDLRQPSRVFLVEAAPTDGTPASRSISPEAVFGPLTEAARRWSSNNLVALRGGAVVIVVPEAPDPPLSVEHCFEDELQTTSSLHVSHGMLNIAVGTRCDAIHDYRHSYLAARRGLDLLRLLGRSGNVFSFRDPSLETVLLQSTHPEVVVKFISRYVPPLDRYDAEHTSDLRRTLEVYFEARGRLEETARRLHIHVSTLRYRLTKAAELLDIDLSDHAAALELQVALKVAGILAVHRG